MYIKQIGGTKSAMALKNVQNDSFRISHGILIYQFYSD